jgi:hypothetical protein
MKERLGRLSVTSRVSAAIDAAVPASGRILEDEGRVASASSGRTSLIRGQTHALPAERVGNGARASRPSCSLICILNLITSPGAGR